jgi:hypothetical protein
MKHVMLPSYSLNSRTQLTPGIKVVIEKLIVSYQVNKFPAFYVTRKFIAVFIKSQLWSLILIQWNPLLTIKPTF